MNRKRIAALMTALVILLVGCKRNNNEDITVPADVIEETEQIEAETETLPPALIENPFDDEEETTPRQNDDIETTEPTKDTEPATEPSEPTVTPEDTDKMDYEKYMSLSAAEQKTYMESFESVDAFFAWLNSAKEEYDAQHTEIEVGDGSFDLDELGGNG